MMLSANEMSFMLSVVIVNVIMLSVAVPFFAITLIIPS